MSKPKKGLLERARAIADASDRWFVAFASSLGWAARRVGEEATIVAESAQKAAATTREVGKGLTGKFVKGKKQEPRLPREALLQQLGNMVLENADRLESLHAHREFGELVNALRGKEPAPRPVSAPASGRKAPKQERVTDANGGHN